MTSVTHVAGSHITIKKRTIQRCAVCGYKLCDNLRVAVAASEGDVAPSIAVWDVGTMIRFTDSGQTELLDGSDLPSDSCLTLVEE
jgi:hypothetical protein